MGGAIRSENFSLLPIDCCTPVSAEGVGQAEKTATVGIKRESQLVERCIYQFDFILMG